ncbi:hypothetical protein [Paenibacillus donghaensis]|uniref:Uncharacterized protein n=1 Tax=Paenibacillus donghaensis TaxID=414771 RepID=A0A2Z2KF93_9BACL|nr:hypothetical protein [Paenibacillus donghaensis]ASA22635.1 hypothetical protein B9T62_18685 [Paenibacillus donghaensis]
MKVILEIPKYGDGDLVAFENKPFVHKEQAIGVVKEVREVGDKLELTILVWDKFLSVIPSFIDNKFDSVSLDFK